MRQLLIATKNAHKTEEIRAILGDAWTISDLTALPEHGSPEETGSTFAENAAIKAVAASRVFPGLVLADDSGLEVDALDGAPGVFSARYAGPNATDTQNRAQLLRELAACGAADRRATFRCVIALARSGALVASFEGSTEGRITTRERGTTGFGYDSLFLPDRHTETFGELAAATKNAISHRAAALEQVKVALRVTAIPYR